MDAGEPLVPGCDTAFSGDLDVVENKTQRISRLAELGIHGIHLTVGAPGSRLFTRAQKENETAKG